jgi:hypothetical protein
MRKFRVQKDSWIVLKDILVGTPDEFNADYSRRWSVRKNWSGYVYTGTFRGRTITRHDYVETGQLPQEYVNDFKDSVVRYVIFSYETPIAWSRIADWERNGAPVFEWVVPDVKYSVTTTKHQGNVRVALSQIGDGQYSE